MPIRVTAEPPLKDLFTPGAAAARGGRPVAGMFLSSGDPTAAEICAGAGLDYLLIDGEHAPLSLESIQAQLRAIAGTGTLALVRVPALDEVVIKQVLDLGAQNVLVPMVHTAEDAEAAVRAMHYPPRGVRGVGSALARSGRWNRTAGYLAAAGEQVTLLVQVESVEAVAHAADIAAVDGVDGVFIGPSDLSATMGLLGQQGHPDVVAAVKQVIADVKAAGKVVGVNAFVEAQAREYVAAGADFVNVGADVALLARGSEALADTWCPAPGEPDAGPRGSY
ncbi:2-dehydro-3-deoxyglucarate aldolase [Citricoccus sp. SGAir0253]|uniref:HpcH/HpaI aldolase family protein n=1 Tax=Citricoccus sp. SGAir0253 TaxID=2567881 RepID=UPI0010CCB9C8|nr:HpcH/HpaI aldolase/citrate lyase family protein [Citricoccus sp. SGAir0253]QCU79079.1 2-dehydro-3-deoxyglucarate aldolase [Citricoccus sp. SGAir0253]